MRNKRQSSQQCHLALLGHTSVKAARKTLVKLTLGRMYFFRANATGVNLDARLSSLLFN
jgi:hypothetical protein